MTPTAAIQASTNLLAHLANPAARALALSAFAGLGLAAFRVKTTSVRLFTWTAVLYAALAMPLLEQMLPPMPIPTPAFLQHGLADDSAPSAPVEISFPSKEAVNLPSSAFLMSTWAVWRRETSRVVCTTAAPSFLSSITRSPISAAIYIAVALI